MYVQVLLIKMHRRAAGVAAILALLSEWHKSRCSSESPGAKVKGYKIQSTSTSETQSKWLVQKVVVIRKGWVSLQSLPWLHKKKDNIVLQHKYFFFSLLTYRLLFDRSDVGQSD